MIKEEMWIYMNYICNIQRNEEYILIYRKYTKTIQQYKMKVVLTLALTAIICSLETKDVKAQVMIIINFIIFY